MGFYQNYGGQAGAQCRTRAGSPSPDETVSVRILLRWMATRPRAYVGHNEFTAVGRFIRAAWLLANPPSN
jgi:hypothetical protein